MATQIIRLEAGQCVILPSDAVVESITTFEGGVVESDCILPPATDTVTYYFYVEDDAAEEGDQTFTLESLVIENFTSEYPGGNRIATFPFGIATNTEFVDVTKANPAVLELRGDDGGDGDVFWSITVPEGVELPYFNVYFTNDSSPWYMRLYPMTGTEDQYASTVAALADSGTIL